MFGVSEQLPWRLRSVQTVLRRMNDTKVYVFTGVLGTGCLGVGLVGLRSDLWSNGLLDFCLALLIVQCKMYIHCILLWSFMKHVQLAYLTVFRGLPV